MMKNLISIVAGMCAIVGVAVMYDMSVETRMANFFDAHVTQQVACIKEMQDYSRHIDKVLSEESATVPEDGTIDKEWLPTVFSQISKEFEAQKQAITELRESTEEIPDKIFTHWFSTEKRKRVLEKWKNADRLDAILQELEWSVSNSHRLLKEIVSVDELGEDSDIPVRADSQAPMPG